MKQNKKMAAPTPNSEPGQKRKLAKPAWMNEQGFCSMCRNQSVWLSVHGVLICGACHPPATSHVLTRVLDSQEIQQLLKGELVWNATE